jgi:4-carboxymuconolactone decarboxylase
MARLPYVDVDAAPEHVAARLRELPPMTVIRVMANAQDAFGAWVGFAGAVLNQTSVSPVLRQISILRVAAMSPGAGYEWDQHEVIARQVGVTDAQIDGARSGSGLEGDDALVARFTEEVVRDVSPSNETWEQMSRRFSPREIVELLLIIGHYMMIARVIATAQVDPDPPIGTALFEDLQRAN